MYREDFLQNDLMYFYHNVSDEVTDGFQLHCHPMYEIYLFMEGDIDYRLEGGEYALEPESILLIAPHVFHGFRVNSSRPYHRFSVHFLPELLEEADRERLTRPFRTGPVHYPRAASGGLAHYYQAILDCLDMPEALRDIALKSRFIALLTQINKLHGQAGAALPAAGRGQMAEVLRYLNVRLREPVSLAQLAGQFYLSKNHLNVLFRQATGTTVHRYLRLKRLALAQSRMLEGVPASAAAQEAGFGDYSNFYRAFREVYGYPPSETRAARVVAGGQPHLAGGGLPRPGGIEVLLA